MKKILVACKYSGAIASRLTKFDNLEVHSVDLLDCEIETFGNWTHHKTDVTPFLNQRWDMIFAFPPCTHLAISGARWFHLKQEEQKTALEFVNLFFNADCKHLCLENPVSIIGTRIKPASQFIQPHQFGHPTFKKTGLWLKNLPLLQPTNPLAIPIKGTKEWRTWNSIHLMGETKRRAKERSRTFSGIADAMVRQWVPVVLAENA